MSGRSLGVLYLIQRYHHEPSQLRWELPFLSLFINFVLCHLENRVGSTPHSSPFLSALILKLFGLLSAGLSRIASKGQTCFSKIWDLSTTNIPFKDKGQKPMLLAHPLPSEKEQFVTSCVYDSCKTKQAYKNQKACYKQFGSGFTQLKLVFFHLKHLCRNFYPNFDLSF